MPNIFEALGKNPLDLFASPGGTVTVALVSVGDNRREATCCLARDDDDMTPQGWEATPVAEVLRHDVESLR